VRQTWCTGMADIRSDNANKQELKHRLIYVQIAYVKSINSNKPRMQRHVRYVEIQYLICVKSNGFKWTPNSEASYVRWNSLCQVY
jgi:beta-galactosidase beta subunit